MTKNNKNLIFTLLLLGLVLAYSLAGNSLGISLDFSEDALTVSASKLDWELPYDQIASLELTELPDTGTMLEGINKRTLQCGSWQNDTWGSYTLCISPKVTVCISITMEDGSVFVLNYENNESTQSLHTMFTELLQSKGFLQ